MTLTVLVAGATGRFGPIVPLLLERGHHVRAGTRDRDSSPARELAAVGAQVPRLGLRAGLDRVDPPPRAGDLTG